MTYSFRLSLKSPRYLYQWGWFPFYYSFCRNLEGLFVPFKCLFFGSIFVACLFVWMLQGKIYTIEICTLTSIDGLEVPYRPETTSSEVRLPLKAKDFLFLKISKSLGFSMKKHWKTLDVDSNELFTNIAKCILALAPVSRFWCID